MLVLSRRIGETIRIGDDIEIVVTRIDRAAVRISISAPRDVLIFRGELHEEVKRLRRAFEIRPSPDAAPLRALE